MTAPLVLNPLMARMVEAAGFAAGHLGVWEKVYADLADGFGAKSQVKTDRGPLERDMLLTIDIEKLLAVERATVETGRTTG